MTCGMIYTYMDMIQYSKLLTCCPNCRRGLLVGRQAGSMAVIAAVAIPSLHANKDIQVRLVRGTTYSTGGQIRTRIRAPSQ
jgi:hypothetical protein